MVNIKSALGIGAASLAGLSVVAGLAFMKYDQNEKYNQILPNTSIILERPLMSSRDVESDLYLRLNSPQNIAYIPGGVANDPYYATIAYTGFTGSFPEININGNPITLQPNQEILYYNFE